MPSRDVSLLRPITVLMLESEASTPSSRPRTGAGLAAASLLAFALLSASCVPQPGRALKAGLPVPSPLGYLNSEGRPAGFVVEALEAAAVRAGLTIEWAPPSDMQGANDALRRGALDLAVGTGSVERHRDFHVTTAWWSSELTVLVPHASAIANDGQLRGRRVALPSAAGSGLERYFGGSVIVPVASAPAAADAVCAGEADAGIIATMFLRELLRVRQGPCATADLRAFDSLAHVEYVLVARREVAREASRLRSALEAITADGTLATIAARHPPVSAPHAAQLAELLSARHDRRFWFIVAVSAALLMLLGAVQLGVQTKGKRALRDVNAQLERDIEARERAQAALLESETRFRTLIEAAPDGIVVVSAGKVVYANAAVGRMAGRNGAQELAGVALSHLLQPERRGEPATSVPVPALRETSVDAAERELVRADGSRLPVEVSIVPFRFEGRAASLVFVRDITSRREAEAERLALQTELLQAQKMESVGRLAGGVAHDFNNLLTVQKGYCEILSRELPADHPLAPALAEIDACTDRAAALTSQLLAFSRRQTLQPRVFDLNELVRRLSTMLTRLIGEHIELTSALSESPATVKADPGQIEQVLLNLSVNARDAMPQGGRLSVSVSTVACRGTPGQPSSRAGGRAARRADARPTPAVEWTTRPGGASSSRSSPPRDSARDTGLGLATVYGVIRQSGGAITVETDVGRGTTFRVFLPHVPEAPVVVPDALPAPRRGEGQSVLVVEDEPALRQLVVRAVEGMGYRASAAGSGDEAVRRVEELGLEPDLLITDIVMPGMDGRALVERLRHVSPSLRVIFMSGYAHDLTYDESPERRRTSSCRSRFRSRTSRRASRRCSRLAGHGRTGPRDTSRPGDVVSAGRRQAACLVLVPATE